MLSHKQQKQIFIFACTYIHMHTHTHIHTAYLEPHSPFWLVHCTFADNYSILVIPVFARRNVFASLLEPKIHLRSTQFR